jgi:hypothetical protein
MRRGGDRADPQAERAEASTAMTDEQFRIIRGLLLTVIILLGFITGLLLALAWGLL